MASTTGISTETSSYNPPLYLVFSRLTLSRLGEILGRYGDVGDMAVVYRHPDGKLRATEMTRVILSNDCFAKLQANGFCSENGVNGVRVVRYDLSKQAPSDGFTNNLFIPVPDDQKSSVDQIEQILNKELQFYAGWGILPEKSWTLNVLFDRESGAVGNGCYITFNSDVSTHMRNAIRVCLTDTYWTKESTSRIHCRWARARPQSTKEKREKREPREVKKTVPAPKTVLTKDQVRVQAEKTKLVKSLKTLAAQNN